MLEIPTLQQWQLYESMPLPCLILTTNLQIVAVNNAFLQENCLERSLVKGQHFFDFIKADKAAVARLQQSFDIVLNNWDSHELRRLSYNTNQNSANLTESETTYWNIKNVAIADDGYAPAHIIHFASKENNTESFLAEVESTEDSIITIDRNLNIIGWNSAAERTFQWSATEAIGKNTIDLLRPQFSAAIEAAVSKGLNGNEYWQGNVTYLSKSGKERTALCTISQFRAGNNKLNGYFISIKDITKHLVSKREQELLNVVLENSIEDFFCQCHSTEQPFKSMLNNMLEGAQIIGFDWTYKYVNDTLVRSSCFKREELLGRTMMDIYPGIEHTKVFIAIQQVMAERTPQCIENEFVFPNGSLGYFQLSIQPVPEGIFILSVDITQRKIAEVKMKESQMNLQNILERISDSFIALDKNWNYVYVNKAAGIMLNKDPKDLVGKNMHHEFPEIVGHHFQEAYNRAMENQEHILIEGYYEPLGLWLENNIFPSPKGLSLFFRDITLRKSTELKLTQSEQNLKAIFDNTSEGFILTDTAGIVKVYNNNIVNSLLLGVSDKIEAGVTIFNIVEHDRRDLFIDVFSKVLSGETIQYDRQYVLATGNKVWVNLLFNPVKKNDEIQGVCISGRDVTHQKNAQEQLKKSFEENLALSERLSAILNNIPANIALINHLGIIEVVNNSWINFDADGFKGKDFGIGQNYIHVAVGAGGSDKDDSINMARGVSSILEGDLDEFIYEYSSKDSAKEKWFRMVTMPLRRNEHAGAVIMHMDISEVKRLESERMQQQVREQQIITQAILHGQEKERNYIGQELHDNINQILAGSRLYLSLAGNKDQTIKELITYPMELLDQAIAEIRLLCSNLVTPQQNIQLKEMLVELLNRLTQYQIEFVFDYNVPENLLKDELKLSIYRIVQELSHNVVKYAQAHEVKVSIVLKQNNLRIIFIDDGVGFNSSAKRNGIGISNITSRVNSFGGKIKIISAENEGSSTIISIPISEKNSFEY